MGESFHGLGVGGVPAGRLDREMAKRFSRRDAAVLAVLAARVRREWKPGDVVRAFGRGPEATTSVARVDGEVVYLADGTSAHWSNVRAAEVVS